MRNKCNKLSKKLYEVKSVVIISVIISRNLFNKKFKFKKMSIMGVACKMFGVLLLDK